MNTVNKSSDKDKKTDSSHDAPYSGISKHSLVTDLPSYIEGLRTSSQPVSHVSPFQSQGNRQEKTTPEICGPKREMPFASFDPNTSLLRMSQVSFLTPIYGEYYPTLPKWGLIVDGELYPQQMWEPHTGEKGGGVWPTPRKHMTGAVIPNRSTDKFNNLESVMARRAWPTPSNSMMTVGDMEQARFAGNNPDRPSYEEANKKWPTPQNRDYRNQHADNSEAFLKRQDHPRGVNLVEETQRRGEKGQLNPMWTCWLMGWPISWTSLEPIEKLIWLNWSVDPADGEVPKEYPAPVAYDATPGGPNNHYKGIGNMGKHGNLPKGHGPIPRIATGIKDRVNRLKAIGNGQVPQCVALAWKVLSGENNP